MAPRGSSKARSVEHEEYVAKVYGGIRSPSSGGSGHDAGDVRNAFSLIECKTSGEPGKPKRTRILTLFEKIAAEAYAEGRRPVLALRFYEPDSILADTKGWVDLEVQMLGEGNMTENIG